MYCSKGLFGSQTLTVAVRNWNHSAFKIKCSFYIIPRLWNVKCPLWLFWLFYWWKTESRRLELQAERSVYGIKRQCIQYNIATPFRDHFLPGWVLVLTHLACCLYIFFLPHIISGGSFLLSGEQSQISFSVNFSLRWHAPYLNLTDSATYCYQAISSPNCSNLSSWQASL